MRHTDPPTRTRRRHLGAGATVGLLGVVAGLAVVSPAWAGEAACAEESFGYTCVSGTQHLDGVQIEGYVTDVTEDGTVTTATVYVEDDDGWHEVGTFTASSPEQDRVDFTRYRPGQARWLDVLLCRHDPYHLPDQCVWAGATRI